MPRLIVDPSLVNLEIGKMLLLSRSEKEPVPSGALTLGQGGIPIGLKGLSGHLPTPPEQELILVTAPDALRDLTPDKAHTVLRSLLLLWDQDDANSFLATRALLRLAGIIEASVTSASVFVFAYLAHPGHDPAKYASSETAFSFDLAVAGLTGRKPGQASFVLSSLARATRRQVNQRWIAAIQEAVLRVFPSVESLEGTCWYPIIQSCQESNPRLGKVLFLEAYMSWLEEVVGSDETRSEIRSRTNMWIEEERALLKYIAESFQRLRMQGLSSEIIGQFELISESELHAAKQLASDGWGSLGPPDSPAARATFMISSKLFPSDEVLSDSHLCCSESPSG